MTRQLADACNPANLPPGMDLYASYVDGLCASARNDPVRISSLATNDGNVGDCEPGNPRPPRWVSWVEERRAVGVDPTIYCADDSLSSFFDGYKLSDVRAAFQAAGVPEPHYWLCLPGATSIPLGAVAVQSRLGVNSAYDLSMVADYWPGVDTVDKATFQAWMREVLNEGTGQGQTSWAGTSAATLSSVQNLYNIGLQNLSAQLAVVKAELDTLKAEIEAGGDVGAASAIARIEKALQSA